MRAAIFPGSFDPFTLGHWDIGCRALGLVDKLYVAVGSNIHKRGLLSPEARVALIRDCFADDARVEVLAYDGLTVDLCGRLGVKALVHGVRSFADFEYERQIAEVNGRLDVETENIFLLASPGNASVSSSAVRELIEHGADASLFLPEGVDLRRYL